MSIVTLKKVRVALFASEETTCFKATVYVDGHALCEASNDGHGGAHYLYPVKDRSRSDIDQVDANLKKTAVLSVSANAIERDLWQDGWRPGLEDAIDEALTDYMYSRDLKRLLGRKTVVLRQDGKLASFKVKYSPETSAMVAQKHPTAKVLNAMEFNEALAIFRQYVEQA